MGQVWIGMMIICLIGGIVPVCGLVTAPYGDTPEEFPGDADEETYDLADSPAGDLRVPIGSDTGSSQTGLPGLPSTSGLTAVQKKIAGGYHPGAINQSVMAGSPQIMVPADLPAAFDWRDHGGDWTTPVRDQGEECGSCWAHAVIGILESHYKIITDDPTWDLDLSEQYLISCDEDDDGCDGGDFATAMPYLVDTPGPDGVIGTVDEAVYPYDETDTSCAVLPDGPRYAAGRWAYVNATAEAEEAEISIPPADELRAAIYLKGPIAVGVYDDDAFDEYDGGIFVGENSDSLTETNHAVILVGWGSESGQDYFIGKNSVGSEWGEDGWFRIAVKSSRIGEGAVYFDDE